MKYIFTLLLSVAFSSIISAQSVTITQPNSGEVLYACQQYPIKWTSSGTSNYHNIDYSLNNGSF